ncbi:hypothetical protein [Exiguobacterium artemiae]|uniref:hypothetical protein n=1 Tax=Exiguobacterium artemiae TaxID=340145 RepID=UPI000039D4FC|nr:hypothetical protein [Exiguobacterium sibiricum]
MAKIFWNPCRSSREVSTYSERDRAYLFFDHIVTRYIKGQGTLTTIGRFVT